MSLMLTHENNIVLHFQESVAELPAAEEDETLQEREDGGQVCAQCVCDCLLSLS